MLAEIHGKISSKGSNLTDRLEDNLTGNIFGTLRYIPFSEALGRVLGKGVYPKSVGEQIHEIDKGFWAEAIHFWPYDREGEIDALIEFEDVLIGIEVKYKSGLSSDDETINDTEEQEMQQSINQLARESRILSKKAPHKKKILLFIADRKACKDVYEDVNERNILESDVKLGYISWQDFFTELKQLQLENPFYEVMVQDMVNLLVKKGFEDFKNMHVEMSQPINAFNYFKFNVGQEINIHINTTLSINGGEYYEFK